MIPVIEWISNCIELERKSKNTTLSLWEELYDFGQTGDQARRNLPILPEGAASVVMYVTGTLDEIRQTRGPFQYMKEPNDLVFLIYGEEEQRHENGFTWKRPDPLLHYLTICYIPQNMVRFYQDELDRFIILTRGKPEIWMRSLLKKNKVAGLVGWAHKLDPTWHVSWSVSYLDFSYGLFLKDDFDGSRQVQKSVHRCPNMPHGLKLGLQRALKEGDTQKKEQLWRQTMDQAAMQMLDEYWLLNGVAIKEFMPQLVRKVNDYYHHIRSIPSEEANVNRVEDFFQWWLQKRGHANAH
ncbi:hypothetical protein JMM81_07335 [Bacillus sp. V3B]|nr:hypothetical protein [Bacillus sp. V3B]